MSAELTLTRAAAKADLAGDPSLALEILKTRDDVVDLIERAENAARILHNAIAAGQIGAGYQTNLDDLKSAIAKTGDAA